MMSVCTLPEGGSVKVGIGDSIRTFRGGDRVDLDAVAVPAVPAKGEGDPGRQAQTWRDVLGEHAAAFGPEPPTEQPKRGSPATVKE